MRSLIVSNGADTGGQNIRWKQAADSHPDLGLKARAVVSTVNSIKYPYDILLSGNEGAVRRLYLDADVIHLNNHETAYLRWDMGHRKPVLMHQHGSLFRNAPEKYLAIARKHGFVMAVSTIDLTHPAPGRIHWLPTAYNLSDLQRLRDRYRRPEDGMVRIVSAPTDRHWKSTEALIAAVEALKAKGLPVELHLIEHATWADCLRRKATADIYFDQVILGYGCNAIEAWGMGIPVIAGADPWTLDRMRRTFGGDVPFYPATEETIADAIEALIHPDVHAEYVEKGRSHVERFHAERQALERLLELYDLAIERRRPRRRTDEAAA